MRPASKPSCQRKFSFAPILAPTHLLVKPDFLTREHRFLPIFAISPYPASTYVQNCCHKIFRHLLARGTARPSPVAFCRTSPDYFAPQRLPRSAQPAAGLSLDAADSAPLNRVGRPTVRAVTQHVGRSRLAAGELVAGLVGWLGDAGGQSPPDGPGPRGQAEGTGGAGQSWHRFICSLEKLHRLVTLPDYALPVAFDLAGEPSHRVPGPGAAGDASLRGVRAWGREAGLAGGPGVAYHIVVVWIRRRPTG